MRLPWSCCRGLPCWPGSWATSLCFRAVTTTWGRPSTRLPTLGWFTFYFLFIFTVSCTFNVLIYFLWWRFYILTLPLFQGMAIPCHKPFYDTKDGVIAFRALFMRVVTHFSSLLVAVNGKCA